MYTRNLNKVKQKKQKYTAHILFRCVQTDGLKTKSWNSTTQHFLSVLLVRSSTTTHRFPLPNETRVKGRWHAKLEKESAFLLWTRRLNTMSTWKDRGKNNKRTFNFAIVHNGSHVSSVQWSNIKYNNYSISIKSLPKSHTNTMTAHSDYYLHLIGFTIFSSLIAINFQWTVLKMDIWLSQKINGTQHRDHMAPHIRYSVFANMHWYDLKKVKTKEITIIFKLHFTKLLGFFSCTDKPFHVHCNRWTQHSVSSSHHLHSGSSRGTSISKILISIFM